MRKTEFDKEMSPEPRQRKSKTAAEALQSLMRLCARAEKSTGDARRLMRSWGVAESSTTGRRDNLIPSR